MAVLQRHQLVHLSTQAWATLLGLTAEGATLEGLVHWAACDWPLVVASQAAPVPAAGLSLGLPLPVCWGGQRLRLQVLATQVTRVAAFPGISEIALWIPADALPAMNRLCQQLSALGVQAQVYGSYGWQGITGLSHVHEGSDLDLLVSVANAAMADAVAAALSSHEPAVPRLDGELLFADGTAVAWREWQHWRSGLAAQMLLKRTDGVRLIDGSEWLAQATAAISGVHA